MFTVPLIACLAVSAPAPQIRGIDLLHDLVAKLKNASTLQAEFIFGNVNDVHAKYKLTYVKPGAAKIESNQILVIANTKDILIYNKVRRTFSKQPQDEASFRQLVTSPEVTVFASFFYPDLFSSVVDPIYAGPAMRGDKRLESVKFTYDEANKAVLYIDPADKVVRQAELDIQVLGDTQSFVLNTSSLKLNEAPPKGTFSFAPPPGSREVAPDDDVWYTDVAAARKAAGATGRLVMTYFYSSWDPASRKMEKSIFVSNVFKRTAKEFVFCKVDMDKNESVARNHGVHSVPTVVFSRPTGVQVHRFTGNLAMHPFMAQMQIAKQRARM